MKVEELKAACEDQLARGQKHITLTARSFPRAGFPRGVLLCVNRDGIKVRMFEVAKILKAIEAAKFLEGK